MYLYHKWTRKQNYTKLINTAYSWSNLVWVYFCRDDQVILSGITFYAGNYFLEDCKHLPFWRLDGVIIVILLHVGVVEFLYYWIHRSFHHHYFYNRYHSHHHSSVVVEPISCKSTFLLSLLRKLKLTIIASNKKFWSSKGPEFFHLQASNNQVIPKFSLRHQH